MFEESDCLTEKALAFPGSPVESVRASHVLILVRGRAFDCVIVQKVDAAPMSQLLKAGGFGAGLPMSVLTPKGSIGIGHVEEVFRLLGKVGKVESASGVLAEKLSEEKVHIGLTRQ